MIFTYLLSTLFLTLTLGLGCDTQGAPPAASACLLAETISVYTHGDAQPPVTTDDLRPLLAPGDSLETVLASLDVYGLERYTMTFAERQVTYVWWSTVEDQDEALAAFCGP